MKVSQIGAAGIVGRTEGGITDVRFVPFSPHQLVATGPHGIAHQGCPNALLGFGRSRMWKRTA